MTQVDISPQIFPRVLRLRDIDTIRSELIQGTSLAELSRHYLDKGDSLERRGARPMLRDRRFSTASDLGNEILRAVPTEIVFDETIGAGFYTWLSLMAALDLQSNRPIVPYREATHNKYVPETRKDVHTVRNTRVFTRSIARLSYTMQQAGLSTEKLLCMAPRSLFNRVIDQIVSGTGRFSLRRHPVLLEIIETLYVRDLGDGKFAYEGQKAGATNIDRLSSCFRDIDLTYRIKSLSRDQIISMLPVPFQELHGAIVRKESLDVYADPPTELGDDDL